MKSTPAVLSLFCMVILKSLEVASQGSSAATSSAETSLATQLARAFANAESGAVSGSSSASPQSSTSGASPSVDATSGPVENAAATSGASLLTAYQSVVNALTNGNGNLVPGSNLAQLQQALLALRAAYEATASVAGVSAAEAGLKELLSLEQLLLQTVGSWVILVWWLDCWVLPPSFWSLLEGLFIQLDLQFCWL
ncbi:hypothetical protein CEUSTIGMA_g6484.t1 [Chlamydomonas eustigma]|uniref:Uncharacterized protein n=1 Tax=Chlamydomonas eustigma TaxID=1157962 RepID=A0A250X7I0_9CHLO|nr:hypothetical protein CEUSTIGMA_g6484.t1 [Chlamydomonas eustigma]|eukprot:GAX79044.1 hypothetical protein CEUSTIGMA_g6484.t1 [Chlamydomonas eustigma]